MIPGNRRKKSSLRAEDKSDLQNNPSETKVKSPMRKAFAESPHNLNID